MKYHVTLTQGRSDTFYITTSTKAKVISFLKSISTAVLRNVKEVVYSKQFNINYIEKPFVSGNVYYKVVVFAKSENYTKKFDLYNIKKSVTQDIIVTQFKKLYINDELINDFISIDFYTEGHAPTSKDNLYQVQYKRNSQTFLEDFHAPSYQILLGVVENLIDGEITEIRKFVYHSLDVVKDDKIGYSKSVFCNIVDKDNYVKLTLPKVRTTLQPLDIKNLIVSNLEISGKKIEIDNISLTYK